MEAEMQERQHHQRQTNLLDLIKEKRYDKRMDQFKQIECVICFECFERGTAIRKIPICKHIFHASCIEGWIKSRQAGQVPRCPLCNTELTEQALKDAIKKNADEYERKKQEKMRKSFEGRDANDPRVMMMADIQRVGSVQYGEGSPGQR